MKDESIVHDEPDVPRGMAHKIRVLSNKSKCVSSASTERDLESIHGATAFEDEYICNGDCIKMNGALDKKVAQHFAFRCGLME